MSSEYAEEDSGSVLRTDPRTAALYTSHRLETSLDDLLVVCSWVDYWISDSVKKEVTLGLPQKAFARIRCKNLKGTVLAYAKAVSFPGLHNQVWHYWQSRKRQKWKLKIYFCPSNLDRVWLIFPCWLWAVLLPCRLLSWISAWIEALSSASKGLKLTRASLDNLRRCRRLRPTEGGTVKGATARGSGDVLAARRLWGDWAFSPNSSRIISCGREIRFTLRGSVSGDRFQS